MGSEGLGRTGRYGRPLGKHHAAKQDPDGEKAVSDRSDPGTTRDEGLNEVDPRPAVPMPYAEHVGHRVEILIAGDEEIVTGQLVRVDLAGLHVLLPVGGQTIPPELVAALRPADRPTFHDLLADDALSMDRRVGNAYAHVRTNKFGSPRPARLGKVKWDRVGEAFLRGFGMALGIVLGACAGVIISGVLVMLLLTAFGAGQ